MAYSSLVPNLLLRCLTMYHECIYMYLDMCVKIMTFLIRFFKCDHFSAEYLKYAVIGLLGWLPLSTYINTAYQLQAKNTLKSVS